MISRRVIEETLSKTFADGLDKLVIDVSNDISFTKRQMIEDLDCGNFLAGVRLSKALKKLGIRTIKQLFNIDPSSLLRIKGIGETAVYVAMCMLDKRGFNVEVWWGWKQGDNVVKFSAYQRQVKIRARRHKQAV